MNVANLMCILHVYLQTSYTKHHKCARLLFCVHYRNKAVDFEIRREFGVLKYTHLCTDINFTCK